MPARNFFAFIVLAALAMVATTGARAEALKAAVFDAVFVNSSPQETTPEETARIAALTAHLKEALEKSGQYHVIDLASVKSQVDSVKDIHDCNGCEADIAKAAGCSVGAVYFRFKDKDALFFAIAESFAEDARARAAGLFGSAEQPPATMIREFVRRTATNYRAHKGLFRAIVERGFDHPLAMKTMMGFRDEMAEALERSLRARIKGRRANDLPLAVRVATQMIYGFFLTGVLNTQAPTRIDDARAVEEAASAVIAYFDAKGLLA